MKDKPSLGLMDISTLLHTIRLSKQKRDFGGGIVNMIRTLKQNLGLDKIVLIQDRKGSRFRKEYYTEYKAHRKQKEKTEQEQKAFDEMVMWNDNLHLFKDFFLSGVIEGVEADDICGMLFKDLRDTYDIVIITTDKDFMSAIPINYLYNWKKNRYYNLEDAKGFTPNQFLRYQGLLGDSSDNIKGLCGEKTAQILTRNFNNYVEMKEFKGDASDLDGVTNRNRRYIVSTLELLNTEEGWDRLKLSYELVQIFRNTSKLNDYELEEYNKMKEEILVWEPSGEYVSEELEDFLYEVGCPELIVELENGV